MRLSPSFRLEDSVPRLLVALVATFLVSQGPIAPAAAQEGGTRLLRQPTISDSHIAFAYANDLWVVPREGGEARRLTAFQGEESWPHFSPDGRWLAFSGEYGGNTDVYVVPSGGGEPRRLTWHPGTDRVTGWTADGARVVFASGRDGAPVSYERFWTVSPEGGLPEPIALPRGTLGEFSPDGARFAYQPIQLVDQEWRNYRGGQMRPIWLVDTADWSLDTLPWEGESTNTDPVWLERTVYFLSDRDFTNNVWAYDTGAGELRQVTHHTRYDVKNLDAGGGAVVYEQAGWLHLYDPATNESRRLDVTVHGDFPWARPHWEDVGEQVQSAAIGPTGARALFEARGEVFTVPAEKGTWRNLSRSSASAERSPAWAPDGEHVAWFSDQGGEYALVIGTQTGLEPPRRITLEDPTFYYDLAWSPGSDRVLFTDAGRRLWVVEVSSGEASLIDGDTYASPGRTLDPVWSPDGRYIAYAKRLPTQFHAIVVHDTRSGETRPLTDGLSDAISPAWDASGDYLWFLASTNFALNTGWLDMSSYQRPVTRGVYFAVLESGEPSPLLPESDEEPRNGLDDEDEEDAGDEDAGDEGEGEDEDADEGEGQGGQEEQEGADTVTVTIDWDGIEHRILALDVPERDYVDLRAAGPGVVFWRENPPAASPFASPPGTLHRYELEERERQDFAKAVSQYRVSHDGEKLLYVSDDTWHIVSTGEPPDEGEGEIDLSDLRMDVDPAAEWAQIFREAWRFQRDYLYVPNLHGADWPAIYENYAPWVAHVRHRSDLTHLLDILGGEVSVGHSFTGGGDEPDVEGVDAGLPGADFEVVGDRYRIARIYTSESWNPDLRAPLSGPGIDVEEGDYLLAVNGRPVSASDNLYAALEGTADRQTVLTVNDEPTTQGARDVTVVPVQSEAGLRRRAWVEDNRRKVDSLSNGRLAYVYLPNTSVAGYTFFNRYYFAQQDRAGAVIDERFNGGGSAADYMVDIMSRDLVGFFNNPVGDRAPFTLPGAGIWGPKVMIINESAGSGGDLLPYMFRHMQIGPLVGTTTWGGLVGIWDVPPLIDGGGITAPRGGFYNLDGEWDVENEGVAPDIEVEQIPAEVIAGRDPQLERAVAEALRLLEESGPVIVAEPAAPVRVRRAGADDGGG